MRIVPFVWEGSTCGRGRLHRWLRSGARSPRPATSFLPIRIVRRLRCVRRVLYRSLSLRDVHQRNSKSPAEECSPCCYRCPRVYTRRRHRNRSFVSNSTADRWEHCRRHLPSSDIWQRPRAFPRRRNCSERRRHKRSRAYRLFVASQVYPEATTGEWPSFPAWSHTSRQNQPA